MVEGEIVLGVARVVITIPRAPVSELGAMLAEDLSAEGAVPRIVVLGIVVARLALGSVLLAATGRRRLPARIARTADARREERHTRSARPVDPVRLIR